MIPNCVPQSTIHVYVLKMFINYSKFVISHEDRFVYVDMDFVWIGVFTCALPSFICLLK